MRDDTTTDTEPAATAPVPPILTRESTDEPPKEFQPSAAIPEDAAKQADDSTLDQKLPAKDPTSPAIESESPQPSKAAAKLPPRGTSSDEESDDDSSNTPAKAAAPIKSIKIPVNLDAKLTPNWGRLTKGIKQAEVDPFTKADYLNPDFCDKFKDSRILIGAIGDLDKKFMTGTADYTECLSLIQKALVPTIETNPYHRPDLEGNGRANRNSIRRLFLRLAITPIEACPTWNPKTKQLVDPSPFEILHA